MTPIVHANDLLALVGRRRARRLPRSASRSLVLLPVAVAAIMAGGGRMGGAQAPARASVTIDAGSVRGEISPLLHGQFLEFMFEGIKSV